MTSISPPKKVGLTTQHQILAYSSLESHLAPKRRLCKPSIHITVGFINVDPQLIDSDLDILSQRLEVAKEFLKSTHKVSCPGDTRRWEIMDLRHWLNSHCLPSPGLCSGRGRFQRIQRHWPGCYNSPSMRWQTVTLVRRVLDTMT